VLRALIVNSLKNNPKLEHVCKGSVLHKTAENMPN